MTFHRFILKSTDHKLYMYVLKCKQNLYLFDPIPHTSNYVIYVWPLSRRLQTSFRSFGALQNISIREIQIQTYCWWSQRSQIYRIPNSFAGLCQLPNYFYTTIEGKKFYLHRLWTPKMKKGEPMNTKVYFSKLVFFVK